MCFYSGSSIEENIWGVGVMVFLLIWLVFVPIVVTSRLEKIIKLLEDKKK